MNCAQEAGRHHRTSASPDHASKFTSRGAASQRHASGSASCDFGSAARASGSAPCDSGFPQITATHADQFGSQLGTAFKWSFTAVVGQTTVGFEAACFPATGGLVTASATRSAIIEVMPALHGQGAGPTVTVQVLPSQ